MLGKFRLISAIFCPLQQSGPTNIALSLGQPHKRTQDFGSGVRGEGGGVRSKGTRNL